MQKALREKLQEKVGDLQTAATKLSINLAKDTIEIEQCQELFRAVTAARNAVDETLLDRRSNTLSEFFRAVGAGILEAQANMDAQTARDVKRRLGAEANDDPYAEGEDLTVGPPTLFRIPRVTAEINYSLETLQGSEVQLIFYSKENQAKEMHQQRVEFEVVATPVPVDYLQAARKLLDEGRGATPRGAAPRGAAPRAAMSASHAAAASALEEAAESTPPAIPPPADPWSACLADSDERVRALVHLRIAAGKGGRRSAVAPKLVPHLWKTVVLRDDRGPRRPGRVLALLALEGKQRALSVWEVSLQSGRVVKVFSLPAKGPARSRLDGVRRFVARLGAAMAARQG